MPSTSQRTPRTLVCAPIMVEVFDAALKDAKDAAAAGADLVEYRIDPAMDIDPRTGIGIAQQLVDQSPLPCIITCRHKREGGEFEGDEKDRLELFEAVCDGTRLPAYIDVEFSAWRANPEVQRRISGAIARTDNGTGLILSTHDFNGRPANLFSLVRDMQAVEEARVLKFAFRARSVRDNLEVSELIAHADRPTIGLAMAEAGVPSRLLAGKWGGFLTFASVREEAATAPGQPTVRDLIETYRFRSITPSTRTFGVIGWPVSKSIGWRVHNAVYGAMGFDGIYMRFPVSPEWESFKATVLSMLDDPRMNLGGCSVTLPHKEHLVRLAREDTSHRWEIDPIVQRVGAANTLAVRRDGSCWIGNTDVAGVIEPLARALGGTVAGKNIAVLGAGGAARGAAIGLADAGARVTIFARRIDRAAAIAAAGGGGGGSGGGSLGAAEWETLESWEGDALVNCTPVGMAGTPEEGGSPVGATLLDRFGPRVVIFDLVYRPLETPLLKLARERGMPVVSGIEMYAIQGAGQVRAWVGVDPPPGLMQRIVNTTLASPMGA